MTHVSCEIIIAVNVAENVLKSLINIIRFDRLGIFDYAMVRQ